MLVSYEVEGECTRSRIKCMIGSLFAAGCHSVPEH